MARSASGSQTPGGGGGGSCVSASNHAYYNALVARGDTEVAQSMRSDVLMSPFPTGLVVNVGVDFWSYQPGSDSDPFCQDAAKVSIPDFSTTPTNTLAADIDASTTSVTLQIRPGDYVQEVSIKIDNEAMKIVTFPAATPPFTYTVVRGHRSTTATSHTAGTPVFISVKDVVGYVRIPISFEEGNTYDPRLRLLLHRQRALPALERRHLEVGAVPQRQRRRLGIGVVEPRTVISGGIAASRPAGFSSATHAGYHDFRAYNSLGGSPTWTAGENAMGPSVTVLQPVQPLDREAPHLPESVEPPMGLPRPARERLRLPDRVGGRRAAGPGAGRPDPALREPAQRRAAARRVLVRGRHVAGPD